MPGLLLAASSGITAVGSFWSMEAGPSLAEWLLFQLYEPNMEGRERRGVASTCSLTVKQQVWVS